MLTAERQSELTQLGYTIEDVHAAWGEDYKGQFRFMINEDQDWGEIQYSEEAAWADADQYERKYGVAAEHRRLTALMG